MATRMCVFCGGSPLTIEDVYPEWLQPYLWTAGSVVSMRWGSELPLTRVDAKNLPVEVKRVCAPCNNVWMSRLEDRAKPVLLPRIEGRVAPLSGADRQLMAAWAVKTTMMLQFTPIHRGGQVIDKSLYAEMWDQRDQPKPPAATVVLTGHQDEAPPGTLFRLRARELWRTDQSGPTPRAAENIGFEATLVIKHLVFAIVGHAGPVDPNLMDRVVQPKGLERIWPLTTTTVHS